MTRGSVIWSCSFALFLMALGPLRVIVTDLFYDVSTNTTSGGQSRSQDELPAIPPPVDVRILSFDPLIAHLKDFITLEERRYLTNFSKPLLGPSTVRHENGTQQASSERTSSSAFLPLDDPVVAAIGERAARFQGYMPVRDIQVTSYQPGQQYVPHWDWFTSPDLTSNRFSTFFAILEVDCHSCGTQFPNMQNMDWGKRDSRLCEFVDCEQSILTSKNLEGSAIFWRNLHNDGSGRLDMLHAGLPALGGTKIGLNIWTEIEIDPAMSGLANAR